jgi:hypothetical protein
MPEANRPQPRNLPTNLDAYAHLLRAKVEQLATVLTDLADVVERCPDAFSRLHLRNLARIAHETVVALAAATSAYATQAGEIGQ